MALKNRNSSSKNTFDKIQKILAENGAKKVMFDYNNDGTVQSLSFAIEVSGRIVGFRLPAMVENVFQMLYGDLSKKFPDRTEKYLEQSYMTAWANIRDWIDAQMALVQTRQVEIAQVFLPYMVVNENQTLYEKIQQNPSFLLN